jgi:hypothetical protein
MRTRQRWINGHDGCSSAVTAATPSRCGGNYNSSVVLVSDMIPGWTAAAAGQGAACRDGAYGHIATDGSFTVTDRPVGWCHYAPDRWIGYGIATGMDKTIAGDVITYEDCGERVSFDARTGPPIRYEAGLNPNATGHLVVTYTLARP